jgi:hypothetical protein
MTAVSIHMMPADIMITFSFDRSFVQGIKFEATLGYLRVFGGFVLCLLEAVLAVESGEFWLCAFCISGTFTNEVSIF